MTKPIPLYNPTKDNFSTTYDINGDGNPVAYTIASEEIAYFEPAIAEHMKKHLANKLVNEMSEKTNYIDNYKEALNRIEVDLT